MINGRVPGFLQNLRKGLPPILCLLAVLAGPGQAAEVLFVVGNTTLNAGDAAVNTLLGTTMGHTVTIRQAAAATTGDATGKQLVVISSTVTSTDVAAKYNTVTQGVLAWEPGIYDDMRMVGTAAGQQGTATLTTIGIVTASHPIAAGRTGSPALYNASTAGAAFGIIGGGGVQVANVPGATTQSSILAYETGVAMISGTANGRRVGFALGDATYGALTADGQAMFRAAVNWAMGAVAPSITTHPANRSVTVGTAATFSVVAAGTTPLSYSWRRNGTAISPSATGSSYTLASPQTGDNGAVFSVVVTNPAGTITSNNATLTVTSGTVAPAITAQPANLTVTAGQTATFNVTATGTAPLTYVWRKNGTAVPGGPNAATYSYAAPIGDNGAAFSVVVSNSAGSATSTNAILTVNSAPTPPAITTQPASQTVAVGQTATFSVSASGAGLSYQWRKGGANISGATSAAYTTPATVLGDNGALFSVVVTNASGSVTSDNATLGLRLVATEVSATRITATEMVTTPNWEIPDYVFEKDYRLRSIRELEKYLAEHKHLPEVPSALEIKRHGMNMGEMDVKLLKNLEELTLHVIGLHKEMEAKERRFERSLDSLRSLIDAR